MRIECVTGRYHEADWVRVVEMDCGTTLLDLHDLIQGLIGFDRDHLFEFYAGRNYRQRAVVFGDMDNEDRDWHICQQPSVTFDDMEDEGEGEGEGGESCETLTLEKIFPLGKNLKLYYYFDFGDDWRLRDPQNACEAYGAPSTRQVSPPGRENRTKSAPIRLPDLMPMEVIPGTVSRRTSHLAQVSRGRPAGDRGGRGRRRARSARSRAG